MNLQKTIKKIKVLNTVDNYKKHVKQEYGKIIIQEKDILFQNDYFRIADFSKFFIYFDI